MLDLRVRATLGVLEMDVELQSSSAGIAVVGPSGGGKSSLLRILAGVERGAAGHIRFQNQVWMDSARAVFLEPWERRVGWVPQEGLLFPHLSVEQNLGYAGADASAIRTIAELLEVEPLLGRRPRNLSGGERQRVALGRALLANARLLLLDEPFAALDRSLRVELGQRVSAHCEKEGVGYVLVSHDEGEAAVLSTDRFLLSGGRLTRTNGLG